MKKFPPDANNSARLAILVVDDEALIRWSVSTGLTAAGHLATVAPSAAEALVALESATEPFDVILLDYRLPDSQDLSLLREVRRRSPTSIVFMMSAFAETQMRDEAQQLGARGVIDKPFRVSDVIATIEQGTRLH